jgi:hypothetical protein
MIVDRRFRGAYCLHHQYIPEDNSEQIKFSRFLAILSPFDTNTEFGVAFKIRHYCFVHKTKKSDDDSFL